MFTRLSGIRPVRTQATSPPSGGALFEFERGFLAEEGYVRRDDDVVCNGQGMPSSGWSFEGWLSAIVRHVESGARYAPAGEMLFRDSSGWSFEGWLSAIKSGAR